MAVELQPCPFCGCPDLHAFEHCEGQESYGFQCTRCWMTGPQFGSATEAITAWNTRPRTEGRGDEPGAMLRTGLAARGVEVAGDDDPVVAALMTISHLQAEREGNPLANPDACYASPIREPEISRTALIAALDAKVAEVGGAFLSNDQAADAILNLAPVGGRPGPFSATSENGWRPIETAPKDGTPVLLSRGGDFLFGCWSGHGPDDPAGCWDADVEHGGQEIDPAPDHWQPLHPPPQAQGGMK